MSCVQLSENACKYFYQATITVGGGVGVFGDRGEDGGLCQISIHKSLAILFILYVFYRPMYMYNKESWADTNDQMINRK